MIAPSPPPYQMLQAVRTPAQPPPYRRNVPQYHRYQKRSSGSDCCFRCVCCFYCLIFLFILVLAMVTFYFYVVYQPKMPSYDVQDLEVKAFNFQPDLSLNTEFSVTVKADNPNTNIGFTYGNDSYISVVYSNSSICTGEFPNFHQGHKNTTIMRIELKGKSGFGSALQEALEESKKNQKIPLLVMVSVPINIVVGEFPLRQFNVFVNCSLVVDNLAPNKKIGIISHNTTFDFRL